MLIGILPSSPSILSLQPKKLPKSLLSIKKIFFTPVPLSSSYPISFLPCTAKFSKRECHLHLPTSSTPCGLMFTHVHPLKSLYLGQHLPPECQVSSQCSSCSITLKHRLVCPPVLPGIQAIPRLPSHCHHLSLTLTFMHSPSLLLDSLLPPLHSRSPIFNHPSTLGVAWHSTSSLRLATLERSLASSPLLLGPHVLWIHQCIRRGHLAFLQCPCFPTPSSLTQIVSAL